MQEKSISQQIDNIIASYNDWRASTLSELRDIIVATDASIIEEIKWKTPSRPLGLPVWSLDGMVCFAEIWKDNIKLIFAKGEHLQDPHNLFNSRLNSRDIRAIELREGDAINKAHLQALVVEASAYNHTK